MSAVPGVEAPRGAATTPLVAGNASIATDVLERYAADAAREAPGVSRLVGRHAVHVARDDARIAVEIHLGVEWGASIPDVGRTVQERVRAYLKRMTDLDLAAVDVVVDDVG